MALDNNKQYLVLNYNSHPVAIQTRYDSYMLGIGSDDEPATLPLTLEEIMSVNNSSGLFKYGVLRFEKQYEADIYAHLRIKGWEDILTNQQIRDIIINPTADGLQKFLDITSDIYFCRVRCEFVNLKNTTDVSNRVASLIDTRYREIINKKAHTSVIIKREDTEPDNADKVKSLENELAQLKEMIANLSRATTVNAVNEPKESPKLSKPAKTSKSKPESEE